MVDQLIDEDEDYPDTLDDNEYKNYLKRVRATAFQILYDEAIKRQKQTITTTDVAERQQALADNAKSFALEVMKRAKVMLKKRNLNMNALNNDIAELEPKIGTTLNQAFEEQDQPPSLFVDDHEPDLEDAHNTDVVVVDGEGTYRARGEEFDDVASVT